jgi:NAD(P)-dependent dehydrogenase (short-subunit alcohol dehydrogenase family)
MVEMGGAVEKDDSRGGSLKGKIALVTGGRGAIGSAISERLMAQGALVVAIDRDGSSANASGSPAASASAAGDAGNSGGIVFKTADITDADAVGSVTDWIERTYGRLDIVVNNAAEFDAATVLTCNEEAWHRVLHTNVDGAFCVLRHALPIMKKRGDGGAIVNVVSVAGLVGVPERAAYTASKGALIALTRQMARDFAAARIRVNAVAPAVVDGGPFHRSPAFIADPERARSNAMQATPLTAALGRMIEPNDVAEAVVFLASPHAVMITGVILPIDAGLTAS